jgi:hypothetical protein
MRIHRPIPDTLPTLPPYVGHPWPAEVVQAHRGLCTAFRASRTALNLDESDPIRLGHHLHQAKTFMVSIVDVLGRQTANPLPSGYIDEVSEATLALIDGLQMAFTEASTMLATAF